MKTPIAILCGDLHLSQHAPPARARGDWFAAMARPLHELRDLSEGMKVPILCTGDVFDKWNPPPELINFAIRNLPRMYAVPGQHDLPYHIGADVDKSAFGTMVQVDRIRKLDWNSHVAESQALIDGAFVYGFGWGTEIPNFSEYFAKEKLHKLLRVAIVHAYCWQEDFAYTGASNKSHVKNWAKLFDQFDVVAFGDNHKGFIYAPTKGPVIMNCGGFMRRKSDEKDRRPMVGILYADGSIDPHYLNTKGEVFDESESVKVKERDNDEIENFVQRLSEVEPETFDFAGALRRWLEENKTTEGVRQMILESIAK